MTDQSKITPPDPDTEDHTGESLIERAAGRFDFAAAIARPAPLLPPAPVRPGVVARSAAQTAAPLSQAPVQPAAPARPALEGTMPPAVDPSIARAVQELSAAAGAMAETDLAPVAPVEPVVFRGATHAIDRNYLREQGFIVPEGAVTELLEEFRIVKRQLLVQSADLRRKKAGAASQRILVSSPHPGEGKTYCALNLALAFAAERECEVLLVDADFAKPSILTALGLPGGPGLMDALMDESIDVADCVIGTDIPGLWVLPAGDTTSHDSEYLSSSRAVRVLDRLTEGAPQRIVIFDSPPALAASPAAELARYVGQAVVIVRADRTGQGALEDAITLLGACPNVQLLLNAAQFSPSGRRFGSYYGYEG